MATKKKTASKKVATKKKSAKSAVASTRNKVVRRGAVASLAPATKPNVTWDPSPNHAPREGKSIQNIVLHNTDGPLAQSLQRLKDPAQQVSAHYVVDRTGDIYQLVEDSETAWHSGNKPMNQKSMGIEIVAWNAAQGLTASQESALITLAKFILDAYQVPLANVVPHRQVKPTDCPGWVWPTDPDLEAWKLSKLA